MSKNWIKIFHKSFNELSYDELYIYASLYRYRHEFNGGWRTTINLYLLESFLPKLKGNKRQRIENISASMLSLKTKGYICFDAKSVKPNTLLNITFPVHEEEGFNSNVTYDLFDLFHDSKRFFIYCNIDRWGENGTKISDAEWCTKLNVSSKTSVRKLIDSMNTDFSVPRIYKFSGDYILNSKKQEVNNYYTRPSDEIKNKWKRWYVDNLKTEEEHKEPVQTPLKPIEAANSDYGNWSNGNDLNDSDYDLYILNSDNPEFMIMAEKKINRITRNKTNDKAVFAINKLMDEADARIRKKKVEEKQNEQHNIERARIKLINNSESNLIMRNDEIIPMILDDLRNNDVLLYVVEEDSQYHGLVREKVRSISLRALVCGITHVGAPRISEDTFDKVKDYTRELLSLNKMSGQIMCEVTKYRDSILAINNQGREHDVEHEGDVFTSYDGTTETNESLNQRRYAARAAKKHEEDEIKRLAKINNEFDVTTLFD